MIKHIVFWKICKDGTEADRQEVIDTFRGKTEFLKTIIPEIVSATVAGNINTGDVFHVCIDSTFNNLVELDRYINHPEHLKVRAYMSSVSYEKTTFDYEY